MAKITLKQTSIVISDYTPGDCLQLENYFTLYDPVTHTKFIKGMVYISETKTLILPRGMDIYLLESMFSTTAHIDYSNDSYGLTDEIMLQKLPKNDEQRQTLRFILGEGEYRYNKYKAQLCVNNNTGSGKTYVASAVAAYTLIRSIMISSTKGIINQWVERLQEYTDISRKDMCIIEGSGSIFRLLVSDPAKYKIYLVTHSSLQSYGSTYGWDKVTELFVHLGIGLKIYDEYHLNFDNMVMIDGYTNTYKTLYLSATPARSSEGENTIYQYCFKNIPAIDLFNPEKDPHTEYLGLLYSSEPSAEQVSECRNQYGLDRNKYSNYVLDKDNFHLMLHYVIHRVKSIRGKALLYIGTNNAIVFIKDWISFNYPELKTKIGIYTSITTQNKEAQLDKKIILSTTKSCGAAMDIYDLKLTIILDEPFKSEVTARQVLGRTRDADTTCIEVVDRGFKQCYNYYHYKQPTMQKYAKGCVEVRLSTSQLVDKVDKILTEYKSLKQPLRFYEDGELLKPLIKY